MCSIHIIYVCISLLPANVMRCLYLPSRCQVAAAFRSPEHRRRGANGKHLGLNPPCPSGNPRAPGHGTDSRKRGVFHTGFRARGRSLKAHVLRGTRKDRRLHLTHAQLQPPVMCRRTHDTLQACMETRCIPLAFSHDVSHSGSGYGHESSTHRPVNRRFLFPMTFHFVK